MCLYLGVDSVVVLGRLRKDLRLEAVTMHDQHVKTRLYAKN